MAVLVDPGEATTSGVVAVRLENASSSWSKLCYSRVTKAASYCRQMEEDRGL